MGSPVDAKSVNKFGQAETETSERTHTPAHTHTPTHTLRVCLPTSTYEITYTHVPGQGVVCCPVDSGTSGQWDSEALLGVTFDIIKFF